MSGLSGSQRCDIDMTFQAIRLKFSNSSSAFFFCAVYQFVWLLEATNLIVIWIPNKVDQIHQLSCIRWPLFILFFLQLDIKQTNE